MPRVPLKIRQARPDESERIMEWGLEPVHAVAMASPQADLLCVHNGKPIIYAKVQAAGVIDGLATDPQAWRGEQALALRTLVDSMNKLFTDLYFFAGADEDAGLEALALKNGFERMPWRVYRRRANE